VDRPAGAARIEWVEPVGLGPFAGTRIGCEFRADAEELLDAGDR
jgi:hypothetical protein